MSYLSIEGLSKSYGDLTVLHGVNLSVEQGEFISLLGPSGCGKTTTLQMIAGFIDPSQGDIRLQGQSLLGRPPAQRGLGMVFQSYALFAHMTVRENIDFGLQMRGVSRNERTRQVTQSLELVQLGAHGDKFPRDLSGGQRQRVALARALIIKPPLLLLDEPLSNLDAKLRHDMQTELRSIQRQVGTTTIMVTHDQDEALAMSDRVALLNRGRIVRFDKPNHLYDDPRSHFAAHFIGGANLLEGEIVLQDGQRQFVCGSGTLTLDTELPCGRATFSLRPERIDLVEGPAAVLNGNVVGCVFKGNCWLVTVMTELGRLQVLCANRGQATVLPGSQVGLSWEPSALRHVVSPSELPPAQVGVAQ
ncbi:ABC transporter ATP-binding protein [Pseudomonas entomophila]|uniref:ABC transporter ATP-binding protein n=1 Tax=Pseudomonas entomophila TaxID=312306 RepID=UPI0023D7F5BE|nr:ABC transporter ATP-binding protein [Pseudomonas entomophila]MDF0733205.1 ABC transporter ATP-binding protein [Pseudomonas entomophila]